ncbi:hypothetical protein [Beduinella massiliensis]|uniref:hypothetical protein n=1 Tax=Beduinella massiliensis TaxID=1852363 RepID=UPI000C827A15
MNEDEKNRGKDMLKRTLKQYRNLCKINNSNYFDKKWYQNMYLVSQSVDPAKDYMQEGWLKGNDPSQHFSTMGYLRTHPDVAAQGINPLVHYELYGRKEGRSVVATSFVSQKASNSSKHHQKIQDQRISKDYSKWVKKLIVYLVPDFDQICGGMMCICNYCNDIEPYAKEKGYDVMLATIPSPNTFSNYTKFDAKRNIYRFEQIRPYFKNLEELIIQIPEYQIMNILANLKTEDLNWLKSDRIKVRGNIMNQNDELMPNIRYIEMLRRIIPDMTMTCAHRKYTSREVRSYYGMPVHYIPADKKIAFHRYGFDKKENLLVVSPDEQPMRMEILKKIKSRFPEIEIVMICNTPFHEYLELIGKARWVLSFGEGFDGYVMESIFSDTIAFSIRNPGFFDDRDKAWPNLYESVGEMYARICDDMERYSDKKNYEAFLRKLRSRVDEEFADHRYQQRLEDYYEGKYTLSITELEKQRHERMEKKPLVSVILAHGDTQSDAYAHTLKSLRELDYENIKLIEESYCLPERIDKKRKKVASQYHVIELFGERLSSFSNETGLDFAEKEYAWRNGLKKAHGEYVYFVDDSTVYPKSAVSQLVNGIDEFSMIHGFCSAIDNGTTVGMKHFDVEDILIDPAVLVEGCMVSREFAEGINGLMDEVGKDASFSQMLRLSAILLGEGIIACDLKGMTTRNKQKSLRTDIGSKRWIEESKTILEFFMAYEKGEYSDSIRKKLRLLYNWLVTYQTMDTMPVQELKEFMILNRFAFQTALR